MKDLKNLKGAKMLSSMEQKSIRGGIRLGPITCGGVECPSMCDCCVDDSFCGIVDRDLGLNGVCIAV